MKEYQINLSLTETLKNPQITVKNLDSESVKFIFTVKNEDTLYDLAGKLVNLAIKKPSKAIVFIPCEVTGEGTCQTVLTYGGNDEIGSYVAELQIEEGLTRAVTHQFEYSTLPSIEQITP